LSSLTVGKTRARVTFTFGPEALFCHGVGAEDDGAEVDGDVDVVVEEASLAVDTKAAHS
jgi:hypothetical protein